MPKHHENGKTYDIPPKRQGPLTRIHVNQHVIKANRKNGTNDPVLTIKRGGKTIKAHDVSIIGPSTVVYSPEHPLSCGATVWIQTHAEVLIDRGTGDD